MASDDTQRDLDRSKDNVEDKQRDLNEAEIAYGDAKMEHAANEERAADETREEGEKASDEGDADEKDEDNG
jgi:hypothetical protein